jgi:hypothetical protein
MQKTIAIVYYYLKAVIAGVSSGILYLQAFLGDNFTFADLGHVSIAHWLGFFLATLGVGGLVGVVANGPKPVPTEPPVPPAVTPPNNTPTIG